MAVVVRRCTTTEENAASESPTKGSLLVHVYLEIILLLFHFLNSHTPLLASK